MTKKSAASLLTRVFAPSRFRSELGDAAAFLRSRVRLYVKTLFFVSLVLTVGGWVGVLTLAASVPEVRAEVFYASLTVICSLPFVFGVGWIVVRKPDRNVALVSGVESACSIAATTAMATTIAFAFHALALVDVLLVVTLVLVTRASFVPSSARRTLFGLRASQGVQEPGTTATSPATTLWLARRSTWHPWRGSPWRQHERWHCRTTKPECCVAQRCSTTSVESAPPIGSGKRRDRCLPPNGKWYACTRTGPNASSRVATLWATPADLPERRTSGSTAAGITGVYRSRCSAARHGFWPLSMSTTPCASRDLIGRR